MLVFIDSWKCERGFLKAGLDACILWPPFFPFIFFKSCMLVFLEVRRWSLVGLIRDYGGFANLLNHRFFLIYFNSFARLVLFEIK